MIDEHISTQPPKNDNFHIEELNLDDMDDLDNLHEVYMDESRNNNSQDDRYIDESINNNNNNSQGAGYDTNIKTIVIDKPIRKKYKRYSPINLEGLDSDDDGYNDESLKKRIMSKYAQRRKYDFFNDGNDSN